MTALLGRPEGVDGYWCPYPEHGVGLGFSRLRDERDGVHGELIAHGLAGVEPNGMLSAPMRINLSAPLTVSNTAKRLALRSDGIPWPALIEQAIKDAVEHWRTGEPGVDLADVEAPAAAEYLVTYLLLEHEINMVYGDGAQGKSLTALLLSLALRKRLTLPAGVLPRKLVEVGYFDWETHKGEHRRRLEALCRGTTVEVPRGIHYYHMARSLLDDAQRLQQEVARKKLGLVIVDSVTYACHGDINDASTVTAMGNVLRGLNTTVLLLHHLSKDALSRTTGRVDPIGSIFFRNGVRNSWELRSREDETGALCLAFFHRKANNDVLERQPLGWRLPWDRKANCTEVLPYTVADDPELSGHASASYVLQHLLADGEPRTIKDIAEATGQTTEAIRKALQRSPRFKVATPGSKGAGNAATWTLASDDAGHVPF